MKINRDSWHYKLIEFFRYSKEQESCFESQGLKYEWEPVTSCQYLRELVLIALGPGLITLVLIPIWLPVVGILNLSECLNPSTPARERAKEERERRSLQRQLQKRNSLAASYLRTRRQHLCELVEYRNDDQVR